MCTSTTVRGAEFETEWERPAIPLNPLSSRRFELKGRIEWANLTRTQELWECYYPDLQLPELRQTVLEWERESN